MTEISGLYYSEDKIFRDVKSLDPDLFTQGMVLYEVLRIWQGKILFLEDHFKRLQESVRLSGYKFSISLSDLRDLLAGLIMKNDITNGNVKLNIHFADIRPVLYTFFIPHAYPDNSMYEKGVAAGFFNAARKNPNIKKLNPEIIKEVAGVIRSRQFYDVLLVGEQGMITEGSKTNVFFIRDHELYTAPGDQVLRGITREKVIGLCNELKIRLHETALHQDEIKNFTAAFFSGTSPKILPISNISGLQFQTDEPTMRSLMKAYDELIVSYIQNKS